MVTDARSAKVAEVGHNSFAEICWYFPVTREQWRISGRLTIIGKDVNINCSGIPADRLQRERATAWRHMSNAGRASFAWPAPACERDPTTLAGPPAETVFAQSLPAGSIGASCEHTQTASSSSAGDGHGLVDAGSDVAASPSESLEQGTGTDDGRNSSVSKSDAEPAVGPSMEAAAQAAYSNFCLVLMSPDRLDHLCLKNNPTQTREVYELAGADGENGAGGDEAGSGATTTTMIWRVTQVNP